MKEFFRGGLMLFIGYNIFNFLNFVFNFVVARTLGPVEYSVFAVAMSIILIFTFPMESIQTVICRLTTKFKVEKREYKIKQLLVKTLKRSIIFSLLFYSLFFIFSFLLEDLLSIKRNILFLTGAYFFGVFLIPITRGILHGKKKFTALSLTYALEGILNLALGTILIYLGFGVPGAIIGVVIGIIATFLFSFIFLKDILYLKVRRTKEKIVTSGSFSGLITITSVVILLSIDISLAKIFFTPEITGYYSAISYLSKIIFLGTWGISRAMFPFISEKHDKKEDHAGLFEKTFFVIFLISSFILLLYFLFHKQIMYLLYGIQYVNISPLLIYPAIAMVLLSLTNVFVLFNLSINKARRNYIVTLFIPLEILFVLFFHSTILEFCVALIITHMLLFFGTVIITFRRQEF